MSSKYLRKLTLFLYKRFNENVINKATTWTFPVIFPQYFQKVVVTKRDPKIFLEKNISSKRAVCSAFGFSHIPNNNVDISELKF